MPPIRRRPGEVGSISKPTEKRTSQVNVESSERELPESTVLLIRVGPVFTAATTARLLLASASPAVRGIFFTARPRPASGA